MGEGEWKVDSQWKKLARSKPHEGEGERGEQGGDDRWFAGRWRGGSHRGREGDRKREHYALMVDWHIFFQPRF